MRGKRTEKGVESSGAAETRQREADREGAAPPETVGKARGWEEEQRSEAEGCRTLELPSTDLSFGGIGALRLSIASLNIRPVLLPLLREAPFF